MMPHWKSVELRISYTLLVFSLGLVLPCKCVLCSFYIISFHTNEVAWLIEECHWSLALWKDKCYDFWAQPVILAGNRPYGSEERKNQVVSAMSKKHRTRELVPHAGSSTSSKQDLFRMPEVCRNRSVSFLTWGSTGTKTPTASIHEEKYSGKKMFLGSAILFTQVYLVWATHGEFQYNSFQNCLLNSSGYLQQKCAIGDISSLITPLRSMCPR